MNFMISCNTQMFVMFVVLLMCLYIIYALPTLCVYVCPYRLSSIMLGLCVSTCITCVGIKHWLMPWSFNRSQWLYIRILAVRLFACILVHTYIYILAALFIIIIYLPNQMLPSAWLVVAYTYFKSSSLSFWLYLFDWVITCRNYYYIEAICSQCACHRKKGREGDEEKERERWIGREGVCIYMSRENFLCYYNGHKWCYSLFMLKNSAFWNSFFMLNSMPTHFA